MTSRIKWEWFFLGLLFVAYWEIPHFAGNDGIVRVAALHTLLVEGESPLAKYPMIGPIFGTPLHYLGYLYNNSGWWLSRFSLLLAIGWIFSFQAIVGGILEAKVVRVTCLLLFVCAMFPNHMRVNGFGAEVFSAAFVSLGLALVILRNKPIAGWLVVGIGAANTPAMIPAVLLSSLFIALKSKQVYHLAAVSVPVLIFFTDNYLRRGSPISTGYEIEAGIKSIMPYSGLSGFSYPIFFGLLGVLFSFGKGLLVFMPAILLRVPHSVDPRFRSYYHALIIFVLAMVGIYSKWWSWWGGWSWGPRFFVLASIPTVIVLALRLQYPGDLKHRLVTGGILLWSLWVGINGLIYNTDGSDVCSVNNEQLVYICNYVPEFSPLFRMFVVDLPIGGREIPSVVLIALVSLGLIVPHVYRTFLRKSNYSVQTV